jgi:bifunctional non-homologous end joining protein LigD
MLPRLQPIIPTKRKDPFDDPAWLFDLKYDGFRALAYLEQRRCRLVSRNGNHLARFDGLGEELAALLDLDDAILDGEVIATDDSGRPQFYELLRRPRGVAYVAFDLLWADGADLRTLPLSARRERLCSLLPTDQASLSEALSVEGRGRQFFELICAHDLEGIVAKRLADPYDRRTRWLKIKNPGYSQQEGRAELFNGPRASRRIG